MFFEGLPCPHLGATILLRGASETELSKLKNVSILMLFTFYSWRLEKSFLMDEFAMPPNAKEFLEDSRENSPVDSDSKTIISVIIKLYCTCSVPYIFICNKNISTITLFFDIISIIIILIKRICSTKKNKSVHNIRKQ